MDTTYMSESPADDKPIFDLIEADKRVPSLVDDIDAIDSKDREEGIGDVRPGWKRKVCMLSQDEEIVLVRRMRAGDGAARDKLISSHWPLCAKVAAKCRGDGFDLMSATDAALIGLITAVDKPEFDPSRFRLATFAWKWMRGEVLKAKHEALGIISIPRPRKPTTEKGRVKAELYRSTPTFLSCPEWAQDQLGAKLYGRRIAETSLTRQRRGDDIFHQRDLADDGAQSPDQVLAFADRVFLTSQLRSELSERERRIYDARFDGDDATTFEALGIELGISGERVRQIELGIQTKLAALETRRDIPRVRLDVPISSSQATFSGIQGRIIQVLFLSRTNRSYRERCQDIYSELLVEHGDSPMRALSRLRWVILKWCRSGRKGRIVRSIAPIPSNREIWARETYYVAPKISKSELQSRHHNSVSWWGALDGLKTPSDVRQLRESIGQQFRAMRLEDYRVAA